MAAPWRAAAAAASPGGPRGRLSVLIYHRVLAGPDPLRPGDVTAETFDRQMAAIARVFRVLPLDEAVERLEAGTLPGRALAITFDDGYRDNLEVALPILRARGLPATVFVVTGTLGGCLWNDAAIEAVRAAPAEGVAVPEVELAAGPLRNDAERRAFLDRLLPALKPLPVAARDAAVDRLLAAVGADRPTGLMMTAAQVRELRAAGVTIGAHTRSHPILATLAEADARAEIAGSRDDLESILGERVRLFAYPNGKPGKDYRPVDAGACEALGFTAAVSTQPGVNVAGRDDRFQLRRFTPWDASPSRFLARLLWQSMRWRQQAPLPQVDAGTSSGTRVARSGIG